MQAKKSLEEKTKESDANKAKIQEVIDKAEPLTVIQWSIGGHSLRISEEDLVTKFYALKKTKNYSVKPSVKKRFNL